MSRTADHLIVRRSDLSEAKIVTTPLPDTAPRGCCVLRIDSFALTANNITYAVAPESIGYWNFFPSEQDGFGQIPVWGFAEVIATDVPDVAVGTRVYGYLPMSSHLIIQPQKITAHGMMDGAAHRRPMSPIYNQYTFTHSDPGWSVAHEPVISLFRPLFTTSFLIDDMHRNAGFFGATSVILSSASSKTAIGVAFLLSRHNDITVIGLTSPGNVAFTTGLGCYDQVIAYDDIADLAKTPAAYVDMAGDAAVRQAVHSHFGADLVNSSMVGITHWQDSGAPDSNLPGARPQMFFAPSYAQSRIADWGMEGFQQRLSSAWQEFIPFAQRWTKVTTSTGHQAALAAYREMLSGQIDPSQGQILSLHQT